MFGWIKYCARGVLEPEVRGVACGQGAKQSLLNILLGLDLPALGFSKPSSLGFVRIRCCLPLPPPKNMVLFFGFEKGLAWRPHFG